MLLHYLLLYYLGSYLEILEEMGTLDDFLLKTWLKMNEAVDVPARTQASFPEMTVLTVDLEY